MSPSMRLKQRMRPLPVWKFDDSNSNYDPSNLSSTSLSTSCTTNTTSSNVEFSSVIIREYERELGMYDDLPNGGLALGWSYIQIEPISVDEYESNYCHGDIEQKRDVFGGGSSSKMKMRLSQLMKNPTKGSSNTFNDELGSSTRREDHPPVRPSRESTSSHPLPLEPTSNCERQKIFASFGFTKEELAIAERERLQKLRRKQQKKSTRRCVLQLLPAGVMRGFNLPPSPTTRSELYQICKHTHTKQFAVYCKLFK